MKSVFPGVQIFFMQTILMIIFQGENIFDRLMLFYRHHFIITNNEVV